MLSTNTYISPVYESTGYGNKLTDKNISKIAVVPKIVEHNSTNYVELIIYLQNSKINIVLEREDLIKLGEVLESTS